MISGGTGDVASGDTMTINAGHAMRELNVRYAAGLGDAAIVSRATLESLGKTATPRAAWVRASDGADASAVTSDVASIAKASDLDLTGGLPERADILKLLAIVLAVTVGFLAIAVLIALIGVSNTLSLSVLERVRENSLLRAMAVMISGRPPNWMIATSVPRLRPKRARNIAAPVSLTAPNLDIPSFFPLRSSVVLISGRA